MYLYHHGIDGQKWGVRHGPPYPLDHKKQIGHKVKQFMHDRFSEYGKDHQAVRDKLVEQYKRKGYNETASQILAEQKYQKQDSMFTKAAIAGALAVTAGPLAVMLGTKYLVAAGGISGIKKSIGAALAASMGVVLSNIDMQAVADVVGKVKR